VKSFSPISKNKDSFGLYYDQQVPDSMEIKTNSKPAAYFSKKNLRDYSNSSRDNNLKYSVPVYNTKVRQYDPSKGMLTTSNFSNHDDVDKKKSNYTKWSSSQIKYKTKKISDTGSKTTSVKYCTNNGSKRPKSAKGIGNYVSSGKYRQSDSNSSHVYKYALNKTGSGAKYSTSSTKKKQMNTSQLRKTQPIKSITTKNKKDFLGSSYRKSNSSTGNKKYAKTSRVVKKSNNSISRNNDPGSTFGSNSSKFSPSGYIARPGIDTMTMNTKSYNSLMTMLMNKEQDMFKSVQGVNSTGQMKVSHNTPGSISKVTSSSRVRHVEIEKSFKRSVDPKSYKKSEINLYSTKPANKTLKKDLEEYLKSSRSRTSRNYTGHTSNAHSHKTHR